MHEALVESLWAYAWEIPTGRCDRVADLMIEALEELGMVEREAA